MKCEIIRRISQGNIESEPDIQISNLRKKQDTHTERNQAKVIKSKTVIDEEDYLQKTIGSFGLWQAGIFLIVTLTRCIALWNTMSIVFLTPITEFKCVEFGNNTPIEVQNSTCYDSCLRYNYSSVTGKNIIEEFQLICERAWLASFTQSILMFGFLLGVSLFGWISDRFGRRPALLLSTFINAVFMIALSSSPNYIIFCVMRFIIGIASGGSLIICVVHVLEIIGKQHREVAGACCLLPDGIAESSLAAFAYFTTDWKGYTMAFGVATCIIFLLMIFVPESPRWLVSKGKVDEAIKLITNAAERNKLDTSNIKAEITKAVEDIRLQEKNVVKASYLDFFKTKKIFMLSITVFLIWLGFGLCFYGIYQYLTLVGINPYLTAIILGLVQLPMCPVGIFLNKTFGRRVSTIGTASVMGIAMIILIFIPQGHWVGTLLGTIAFTSSTIAFAVAYIYVSELFPTPLRNMALGMSSGGAKIGAMMAPFVANLIPRWLPSLIFGLVPLVAGLCCLFLPETKGQNLKDTIEK